VSDFPQVTAGSLVRALKRAGFVETRQSGSHLLMRHRTDFTRRATVPIHGAKPVRIGTLRAILKGAGITPEELRLLL
jgi:predicted RNA binding protein YcfA (HicA-like mRNA interferase family)